MRKDRDFNSHNQGNNQRSNPADRHETNGLGYRGYASDSPGRANGEKAGTVDIRRDDAPTVYTAPNAPVSADGEIRGASGSSFAARFGRAIAQHGIAAIPSALFHYQGSLDLSAQEVWFISYVMCFKWDENLPRVNLSQMEKRVGMGKRSLYRLKERLCEADYLKVFPVYTDNGRQESSAYDFSGLFEQIERLILADPPRSNPIHTDEPEDVAEDEPVERDMSFLARFGRVIARYGVAAVPQAVFTYQAALGLKPQQVWFIAYIFSYQWKKALPYPSIVKMSARTGYSTVQLHEIKAGLVDFGYLRLVQRSTKYGGKDSNAYDFSGLFDAIRVHLQREHAHSKPAPTRDVAPTLEPTRARPSRRRGRTAAQHSAQEKHGNKSGSELPYLGDSELTWEYGTQLIYQDDSQLSWQGDAEQPVVGDSYFSGDNDPELAWEDDSRLSTDSNVKPPTRVTRSLHKRVTPGLHNVEPKEEEKKNTKRYDSNHISQRGRVTRNESISAPSNSSVYIVSIMDDFSNELNDSNHKTSNTTQALRIWELSGKGEQEFVQLVYEAKQITRKYQGKNGVRGIENKMAYFFAVLRDLCGLRDDTLKTSDANVTIQEEPTRSNSRKPTVKESNDDTNAQQLWYATLAELQATVPAPSFQTWLKNTSIVAFMNNTVVIAVPSTFAKEWLEKRYRRQISETLNNVLGYRVEVRVEVKTPGGPLGSSTP